MLKIPQKEIHDLITNLAKTGDIDHYTVKEDSGAIKLYVEFHPMKFHPWPPKSEEIKLSDKVMSERKVKNLLDVITSGNHRDSILDLIALRSRLEGIAARICSHPSDDEQFKMFEHYAKLCEPWEGKSKVVAKSLCKTVNGD